MNVRTHWPWMSMLLAAVLAFNPIGLDVINMVFFSNEGLSRNIWAPIVLTGVVVVASIGLLEWRIRKFMINRRAPGTTNSS